ncbi:hypothetical protein D9M68_710520 [compost metagenome]
MFEEGRVEAAHAAEAAGQRDLGHRQVGVGQQLFGGEQFAREQVLQGRDAQPLLEHAAQMPVAHAQARGQPFAHVAVGVQPVLRIVEPECGLLREDGGSVFPRPVAVQRCQLGPTAQAGAEPGVLGLGGMLEKAAVLAPRRGHATHRPAVDAGGGDGGEELAVETRVVRAQRAVASVLVDAVG